MRDLRNLRADAIVGDRRMFARMLYFVSVVIAFALIVGTTVLCLAADNGLLY